MRRQMFGRAMVRVLGMGLLMAGVVAPSREGVGQRPTGVPVPPSSSSQEYGVQPPGPSNPLNERMQEKQAASVATERHKRMVADADKLLQLATELKQDVDGTTKNEMSVPTIRKAAEIEKLAHDVKERMKGE